MHMPDQVFADLAAAIADGADAVTGIEVLRGPERASPVPAATIDTFRTPYTGESLTAALPGSTPLHGLHPDFRGPELPTPARSRECR